MKKGKSRDLQRLLKYFNKITTSVLEGGIPSRGSCSGPDGWDPSRFGSSPRGHGGRGGLAFAFPVNFVLYLNDLLFEASSSTSSILPR